MCLQVLAYRGEILVYDGEGHLVHVSVLVLLEGLNLVQTLTLLYHHAHLVQVLQLVRSLGGREGGREGIREGGAREGGRKEEGKERSNP